MIDHGFRYKDKNITIEPLRLLVDSRLGSEYTPLFKLSSKHLNMSSHERQNVSLAAQLLSRTTATTLRRYSNNDDAKHLAEFIEKVGLWFSVSNSYSPKASLDYKKSFICSEDQVKALDDINLTMKKKNKRFLSSLHGRYTSRG